MSSFSKNLRYLRKKGNHNQDEISNLFNKRANTIGNWENQKSEPSLTELIKLGEYFNVSLQDLAYNADLEDGICSGTCGLKGTGLRDFKPRFQSCTGLSSWSVAGEGIPMLSGSSSGSSAL